MSLRSAACCTSCSRSRRRSSNRPISKSTTSAYEIQRTFQRISPACPKDRYAAICRFDFIRLSWQIENIIKKCWEPSPETIGQIHDRLEQHFFSLLLLRAKSSAMQQLVNTLEKELPGPLAETWSSELVVDSKLVADEKQMLECIAAAETCLRYDLVLKALKACKLDRVIVLACFRALLTIERDWINHGASRSVCLTLIYLDAAVGRREQVANHVASAMWQEPLRQDVQVQLQGCLVISAYIRGKRELLASVWSRFKSCSLNAAWSKKISPLESRAVELAVNALSLKPGADELRAAACAMVHDISAITGETR